MDPQNFTSNGAQQGGQASDSKQAQIKALQEEDRYKGLLRPEHFTLQNFGTINLSQQQLDGYREGVKKLWEALVDRPEGSKDYETAKTRLSDMTTKLSASLNNKRTEDAKKNAQRQSTQSQAQGSNLTQSNAHLNQNQNQTQRPQPTSQPMSNNNSSTNADLLLQEQVKKEVEKQQWTLPAGIADGSMEAQKWLSEITTRYSKALMGMKKAELAMKNLQYWTTQQQKLPGYDKETVDKELYMRRQAIHKQHAESKSFIDKLMQSQQNNKAELRAQQQQLQNQPMPQIPPGSSQAQNGTPQNGNNLQNGRPLPGTSGHPHMTQRPQQTQGVNSTYNHNGQQQTQNNSNYQQRQQPPPTQLHDQQQRPNTQQGQANTPVAFTTQQAIDRARAQSINSNQQQHMSQSQQPPGQDSRTTISADPDTRKVSGQPISKSWQPQQPQPVNMGASRPTLSGANNGPVGPMGQPAIQKPETFLLQGAGDRVLERKKLDELYRQVCGADAGEGDSLDPDVAEVCRCSCYLPTC